VHKGERLDSKSSTRRINAGNGTMCSIHHEDHYILLYPGPPAAELAVRSQHSVHRASERRFVVLGIRRRLSRRLPEKPERAASAK
jgi:hypothetical protein